MSNLTAHGGCPSITITGSKAGLDPGPSRRQDLTTSDPRSRSNQAQGGEPGGSWRESSNEAEDDEGSGTPFVVEFAGTPRAGKTTALRGLRPRLERLGYRVRVVEEQARVCSVPSKRHPDFNLWTASATVAEVIQARYSGADVLLVDRGPFDALTWMDWFRRIGVLPDGEHEAIHRYLGGPTLSRMVDLVLVMTVDPHEALHRERSGGPHRTPGPIINTRTLHTLNDSIDAVIAGGRHDFGLQRLDTTLTSAPETLCRVSELVRARLRPPSRLPPAAERVPVALTGFTNQPLDVR